MKVRTQLGKIVIGEGEDAVALVLCKDSTPIRPTEEQQKSLVVVAKEIRRLGQLSGRF